jgi:hypothetical protein
MGRWGTHRVSSHPTDQAIQETRAKSPNFRQNPTDLRYLSPQASVNRVFLERRMHLFQQIDSRTFVHRIDVHGRLISVNPAWLDFAAENGWPVTMDDVLGQPLMNSITDPNTHYLYGLLMTRLRHGRGPFSFNYRCDAPDCRRLLRMRMFADQGTGEIEFHNDVLRIDRRPSQILLKQPRPQTSESITLCGFCKRVDVGGAWVEVEEAIMRLRLFDRDPMPATEHRVCPDCAHKVAQVADGN